MLHENALDAIRERREAREAMGALRRDLGDEGVPEREHHRRDRREPHVASAEERLLATGDAERARSAELLPERLLGHGWLETTRGADRTRPRALAIGEARLKRPQIRIGQQADDFAAIGREGGVALRPLPAGRSVAREHVADLRRRGPFAQRRACRFGFAAASDEPREQNGEPTSARIEHGTLPRSATYVCVQRRARRKHTSV